MNKPLSDPGRKSLPHLSVRDRVNQSIIVFLTVGVNDRRKLLARPEVSRTILERWERANFWLVGRYVLMPDHLHLFCAPALHPPTSLKQWVEFWRSQTTYYWPYNDEKPIWQKDFFDYQLRTGDSYRQKWEYVRQNPVRAGLVKRAEDWPYQGELNTLLWHEPAI